MKTKNILFTLLVTTFIIALRCEIRFLEAASVFGLFLWLVFGEKVAKWIDELMGRSGKL